MQTTTSIPQRKCTLCVCREQSDKLITCSAPCMLHIKETYKSQWFHSSQCMWHCWACTVTTDPHASFFTDIQHYYHKLSSYQIMAMWNPTKYTCTCTWDLCDCQNIGTNTTQKQLTVHSLFKLLADNGRAWKANSDSTGASQLARYLELDRVIAMRSMWPINYLLWCDILLFSRCTLNHTWTRLCRIP